MSFYLEGVKVGFSSCLLRDQAHDWWEEVGHALGFEAVVAMTWQVFVTRFNEEFAPTIKVQQLLREFQDFARLMRLLAITVKFREWSLWVLQYAVDEEMQKTRYHDMLRDDIRVYELFGVQYPEGHD